MADYVPAVQALHVLHPEATIYVRQSDELQPIASYQVLTTDQDHKFIFEDIFGEGDQEGQRTWDSKLEAILFSTQTDNGRYEHYFFPKQARYHGFLQFDEKLKKVTSDANE